MVYFPTSNNAVRNDALAVALKSETTFTISFWVRPESGPTVPTAFEIADSLAFGAATQYFLIVESSGAWFLIYDDGAGGAATLALAFYVVNEWRFLSIEISPGTSSGWKVRSRARFAGDFDTWESDITHDNQPEPSRTGWAEHALPSSFTVGGFFEFTGHIAHVKVWTGTVPTSDELWRESQRALPFLTSNLLTWNPLRHDFGGGYFLEGIGSLGNYSVVFTPGDDTEQVPITERGQVRAGPAVDVAVPREADLVTGFVEFAGANLQVALGLAPRLCGGAEVFAADPLAALLGVSAPIPTGAVAFEGAPLVAAPGLVAALCGGAVEFAADPLVPAPGLVAALCGGAVEFAADPLVPALGVAAALQTGTIEFGGTGLVAADAGAGVAVLATGSVVFTADPLVAVEGLTVPLQTGAVVFDGDLICASTPSSAVLQVVESLAVEVLDETPTVAVVADDVTTSVDGDVAVELVDETIAVEVPNPDIETDVDDEPPTVTVEC